MTGGKPVQGIEEKGATALPDPVFVGRLAGFCEDQTDEAFGVLPEGLAVRRGVLPVAAHREYLLEQPQRGC